MNIGVIGKPKVEHHIKVDKIQRETTSLEKTYYYLKSLVDSGCKKKKLNIKGRKYYKFPLIEKYGIIGFETFKKELNLINERRSTLPSTVRRAVTELYLICLNELNKKQ